MDNAVTQYHVSLFPYSGAGDTPSFTIHMEIAGDFEQFMEYVSLWLAGFGATTRIRISDEPTLRFCDGVDDDLPVFCDEEDILFALLYCCKNPGTTVREISFRGNRYTDISDMRFLKGFEEGRYGGSFTYPVLLRAKKDGHDTLVYFFGPYVSDMSGGIDIGDLLKFDGEELPIVDGYPMSHGMVEMKEGLHYAGTYYYNRHYSEEEPYTFDFSDDPDAGDIYDSTPLDEQPKFYELTRTSEYDYEEGMETFLETDGKNVTFSILYKDRLYKKISKDGEKVIFYDTPFDGRLPETEQGKDPHDVIFENRGGKYVYAGNNRSAVFTPPQMPDTIDEASAHRLCQDYIDAWYAALDAAFESMSEYKSDNGYLFRKTEASGDLFQTEADEFILRGEFTKLRHPVTGHFLERYDLYPVIRIDIESIAFTENGTEVKLFPRDDFSLAIAIEDPRLIKDPGKDTPFCTTFDKLNRGSVFSRAQLPETVEFDRDFKYFAEDMWLYAAIRKALIDYGIHNVISSLSRSVSMDYDEMKKNLYGEDMIHDETVVSFAVELKNAFNRTGEIPNLALIGEAGTGKTTMVKKLGGKVFNKEVLCLSPSDLKGTHVGWTKAEVVKKLIEAAEKEQIFFIDEAYELMSDQFGREAVSLLLPLMTGDRTEVDATVREGTQDKTIKINFQTGEVEETGRETRTVAPGVPPIWISGYEDDIRLMTSQNQGLFRRFKRLTLKSPTANQLYDELNKKLEDAITRLSAGEDSELFQYVPDMADAMKYKFEILKRQFGTNENLILKFFRWGAQPQNSRYFASHAGVSNFLALCLDGIDYSDRKDEDIAGQITAQIENIIMGIKRDIRHQLDTIRRKGNGDSGSGTRHDDSERVEMIFDIKTRFNDLVGCDSQIGYMKDIIDMFLKKSLYEQSNITVPKGALLLGAPGVGKTFIASALAGELQEAFEKNSPDKRVGFMSLSAPELTAKPVSFIGSIFDKAEEYDVCVIFIDEVDAIAKNRFENGYYSHFIELIKQMDGIEQRSSVFILAATNAPESLDPAFTRSGRIDKKLSFTLPDKDARTKLAKRNLIKRRGALSNFLFEDDGLEDADEDRKKIIDQNRAGIDKLAQRVAEITRGYTPGDMENVINEAFIRYKQEKQTLEQKTDQPERIGSPEQKAAIKCAHEYKNAELDCLYSHIYEAVERKDIGEPHPASREKRFSIGKNDQSCSSVSIHEVGHAVVSRLYGCEPFEKITSLPRGSALGYVMPSPKVLLTKADYENRIRTAMGGRIAEELVYGEENISVGAAADMRNATGIARDMVEKFGFTEEFGFMALREDTARYLGRSGYSCSESFREQSDGAVCRLLKKLYDETREKLADKKDLIIRLARKVFEEETMTGAQFNEYYEKALKEG